MNDKRIKITSDWAIIIIMVLIASCFLFAANARADIAPGVGILCNSQEEIESIAAHAETGFTPVEAIDAVNGSAGTTACGFVQFISSEIEVVHRITVKGNDVVILKLTIVAVMSPTGPVPASIVQYTIAAAEGFVPARLGI